MLNIHSFLHGKLKNYSRCGLITAYALVGIILVLSTDSSYGLGGYLETTLVKAQTVQGVMGEQEEAAMTATIQLEENKQREAVTMEVSDQKVGLLNRAEPKILQQLAAAENQILRLKNLRAQRERVKEESQRKKEEIQKKEEARRAQEEARKKKEKEKADKEAIKKAAKGIIITSKDRGILHRIVEAEATGEDIKGKMLVANVILNRVSSKKFPSTIEGVVFQRNGRVYQFSPIRDGRYWSVAISKDTKKAVDKVLQGEDASKGALYFSARKRANKSSMRWFDSHLTRLFQYGGHEFFK